MKKILPILIATLTPFVLIGCNSVDEVKTNDKESSEIASNSAKVTEEKSTPADSITKNWTPYTSKDGSYTVKFPGKPQEQNQSADTPIGKLEFLIVGYSDNKNSRAYMTTVVDYPVNPSDYDVEKGLDGARDGAANNTNSQIVREDKITYNDDYPGREIVLQNPEGMKTKARIFIDPKGPTLYQSLIVAEDGNVTFPEADAFFKSLVISK